MTLSMPACFAMAAAVTALSPVSMMGSMPIWRSRSIAAALVSFSLSLADMRAASTPSAVMNMSILPSADSRLSSA